MRCVKKMGIVLTAVFCAFAFSGCYTKLASYQSEAAPYDENCGECVEERAVPNTREICVWERDMFGFAQLRCYNSNYSSSWFYFHNTPWWYRNQYRWYETRGCPPHYYYDRVSGSCRYYGNSRPHHSRPSHPSGGGGGGGSANSGGGSGIRAPRRDLPGNSQTSDQNYNAGAPMFSGSSTKQLSPVGTPSQSSPSNDALSKGGQESKNPPPVQPPQKPKEEKEPVTPSRRTSRGR